MNQLQLDISDELTKQVVDKILKDNPHVQLGEPMATPLMALSNSAWNPTIISAQSVEVNFDKKIELPANARFLHVYKVFKPTAVDVQATYTFGADHPLHIAFGIS